MDRTPRERGRAPPPGQRDPPAQSGRHRSRSSPPLPLSLMQPAARRLRALGPRSRREGLGGARRATSPPRRGRSSKRQPAAAAAAAATQAPRESGRGRERGRAGC
eukprot:scaffold926_cov408-Prasinococcus_capsulatus_cf.AAC.1